MRIAIRTSIFTLAAITALASGPSKVLADELFGVKFNNAANMNEIYLINTQNGQSTLLKQFNFPGGGWHPESSYVDPTTGKLFMKDSAGFILAYDRTTNDIQTLPGSSAYSGTYQATFPVGLAGGTNSIVSTGIDANGRAITILGTQNIVAGGKTLIKRDDNGAVHIGDNSLITVEQNGQQLLYATDVNGNPISINVTNGSDLLVNGTSVVGRISTIDARGTRYMATNMSGPAASATGANSAAIGSGAVASAANSVALGAGSVADADNTVSVGTPGSRRRITNLAPGTDSYDAVTLGQLKNVSNGASMAMAMTGGFLPEGKKFAMSMNQGFFGGTTATAASGYVRLQDDFVLSGGLSYGYTGKEVGSRVGFQFAW